MASRFNMALFSAGKIIVTSATHIPAKPKIRPAAIADKNKERLERRCCSDPSSIALSKMSSGCLTASSLRLIITGTYFSSSISRSIERFVISNSFSKFYSVNSLFVSFLMISIFLPLIRLK